MAEQNQEDWAPFKSKIGMVRLILSVAWDPITLFGHRNTLDEYDWYAESVLELAEATESPEKIAGLLRDYEKNRMRLSHGTSEEARLWIGKKIVAALCNFEDRPS